MIDYIVLLVLRLFHIGSGVFWVGGFLLMFRHVIPASRAAGPAAGPFMQELMVRQRLPAALSGAAFTTILSGFLLYGRNVSAMGGAWATTHAGMAYGWGGLAALIALGIGLSVNMPAGRRMGAIGAEIAAAGGTPSAAHRAEMERLQARTAGASRIIAALLFFAVAAMALARYL
jgi:hypothetical protein